MFVSLKNIPEKHRDCQIRFVCWSGAVLLGLYVAAICFGVYVTIWGY